MKIRAAILILSIIYCIYLLVVLIASHYKSATLNPLNSEYYYQNSSLTKAIETEPSKAEYHMYYGLELLKTLPNNKSLALNQLNLAKKEFSRATQLKSYSALYKKIPNDYTLWIEKQLNE